MTSIATLITCHNRKAKTIACLDALFNNTLPEGNSIEVYLVDDGSTDDTDQAVCEMFPKVNIIKGDGSLYWNGGMRVAFAVAMNKGFDFYLWLNDDTSLHASALHNLLDLAVKEMLIQRKPSVIVGTTQIEVDGPASYGGLRRFSFWRPLNYTLVSEDVPAHCDTMNGNCVLIPSVVANEVGNLDPIFVHAMGDIDYGLRVGKAGFPITVLPGFIGVCENNSINNSFMDMHLSVSERWKKIMGLKGLPPSQWYVLTRRHAGLLWPLVFVWPYIKVIFGIRRMTKITFKGSSK